MADKNTTSETPDKTNTLPQNAGKEYGQSGTLIYSGIIVQEEYNRKLLGREGLKIFEEMRRSDTDCQELLKACKLPIQSVQWRIQKASDDEPDVKAADFIERELFDRNIKFSNLVGNILTMFDFGFSLFEKVFELTTDQDGNTRVGIKKLAYRKQYSLLKWQQSSGDPGITQQVAGALIDIPLDKLLVFSHDKEGDNWSGVSLLRYCYRDWYAKKILLNIQLTSLERLGMGVPVLLPPEQPDPKDVAAARVSLRKMRANQEAYIELPKGWLVEMLDMKGHTTKDILPTLEYVSGNIKKSGLAGFLDLGSRNNGGSHAVGQDQSQIFEKSLEAVAQVIADVINEQLIQELCNANFSDLPNGYPKLEFGNIGDEALEVMGQYLNWAAGVDLITPDPDLENHLRKIARLPDLPTDIYEDYDNRLLNQKAIKHIAMVNEKDELAKLTPPAAPPGETIDPDLPAANTPAAPAKTAKKVKAHNLRNARQVQANLIQDIIAG